MSSNEINFADTIDALSSGQVWEYETGARQTCRDVPKQVFDSLHSPLDFPPIEAAIVAGDRVALAVDPNVPAVEEVVQGAIKAFGQTDADKIEIVLWDEASDETVSALRDLVGQSVAVTCHRSSDRTALRYVGADAAADPIYLNRLLVDADFVLPIAAGRPLDTCCNHDLTGVFPSLADSASRKRHCRQSVSDVPSAKDVVNDPHESSWLLGVQLMISVTAGDRGGAGQILAGTPEAIRKQLTPSRRLPDDFPPPAALVIASLDGDSQQQTWGNAARAVAAASRYVQPGGTIVMWSAIDQPPSGRMLNLADAEEEADDWDQDDAGLEDGFPPWDEAVVTAQTLARIAAEYRLLIHSRLDEETIESMGLASIESADELTRLSQTFSSCGVLRAAQFAGTTIDTTRQLA